MATASSSTPSFFSFLKEGVLLPTRNRSLFTAIFALIFVSSSLVFFTHDLAIQPLSDELQLDIKALTNATDPGSPEYAHLVQEIKDDTRDLLLGVTAYVLFAVVVGCAVRVVLLFAAVATYSGELLTFRALLGKAKAQLRGPLVTFAFVYALEIAYTALLTALVVLAVYLGMKQYFVLVLVISLLVIAAALFFVYFAFVCSLGVIVAVAEPGCRGAGAVGRAWRMVKGKRWRAMVFLLATGGLVAVVSPVHALAKTCILSNVASGLLLEVVYTALMTAVNLVAVCAFTAYYYECKGSAEAGGTEYVKLSTQDA